MMMIRIYPRSFKPTLLNLGLVITSLMIAMALVEGCFWLFFPRATFKTATELPWMHNITEEPNGLFTIDPEFGFRPNLGNGTYNLYGTLENHYKLEKSPHKIRLLFIGDSVTARGKIIAALRIIYGGEKYEYWNAGVESFNTVQETAFYEKFNYKIKPDQVILSFHPNDFETTPIAFYDQDRRLVVYAPRQPLQEISPWLYKNSFLYRIFLRFRECQHKDQEKIVREVQKSLVELKNQLGRDKISFTVLMLPLIKPYSQWSQDEKARRQTTIRILQEEHIRYFDLSMVLEDAWHQGLVLKEEPRDDWHPNDRAGAILAAYLAEHHLF
jgi:hypothetical protein